MKQYTQKEFLEIMQEYNTMDRKIIKQNLRQLKQDHDISLPELALEFDFKLERVKAWFNIASNNVPLFEDCLRLCVKYGVGIEEIVEEKIEKNNYIYTL